MDTGCQPGLKSLDWKLSHHDIKSSENKIKTLRHYRENDQSLFVLLTIWIYRIQYEVYPHMRQTVIEEMKCLLEKDPDDLNLLAEYCNMCDSRHRDCKAERLRLEENLKTKPILRSLCKLEQAYFMLYTDPACGDEVAIRKISDSKLILQHQSQDCSANRKPYINRAIVQASSTIGSISDSLHHLTEEEKCDHKHTSKRTKRIIDMFEEGIRELEMKTTTNLCNWKYHLAMTKFKLLCNTGDPKISPSDVFNDFVIILDDLRKLDKNYMYYGRSLAYIGYLIYRYKIPITKNQNAKKEIDVGLGLLRSICENKGIENTLFQSRCICEKAVQVHPFDADVRVRISKVLLEMSKSKNKDLSFEAKLQNLDEAYSHMQRIKQSETLRSVHRTRCLVQREIGIVLIKNAQTMKKVSEDDKKAYTSQVENAEHRLCESIENGMKLFHAQRSARDICELSKCYQEYAKLMDIHKKAFPVDYERIADPIMESLYYLSHAVDLVGVRNFYVNFQLGVCWFQKREIRKAIECMKLALVSSDPNANPRFEPYKYLLTLYQREGLSYYFAELQSLMGMGFRKYKSLMKIVQRIEKEFPKEMKDFKNFVKNKHKFQSDVVNGHFWGVISKSESETITDNMQNLTIHEPNDNDMYESSKFLQIPINQKEPEKSSDGQNYDYDFFLSHTQNDKDWARGVLLQFLETNIMNDDEKQLKGCFEDRDFTVGKTRIDNIIDAVTKSRWIILICTPDFVECGWKRYETEQSLIRSLNENCNCLMVVKLKECVIPTKLEHLKACECIDETEAYDEIRKMKRELLMK